MRTHKQGSNLMLYSIHVYYTISIFITIFKYLSLNLPENNIISTSSLAQSIT